MGPFKAAVFDLAGTLVQSEDIHRESLFQPQRELGIEGDEATFYRDFAGKPGMQIIFDHVGLSVEAANALYQSVNARYREIAVDSIEPTIGLIYFLDRLGDIPKAVCTSAQREAALRMLEALSLIERLTGIVTATDVMRGKPDPEPFLLAARQLNAAPNLCVALEDSANGLRSARAAGMYCVGIEGGIDHFPELAGRWVAEFKDDALKGLLVP